MKRNSMIENLEQFAADAISDEEQELWEKKELGNDPKYVRRSSTLVSTSAPQIPLSPAPAIPSPDSQAKKPMGLNVNHKVILSFTGGDYFGQKLDHHVFCEVVLPTAFRRIETL